MQALGRQILIEFYECQSEILTDRNRVRQYMLEAAHHVGATVISDTFHHFKPDGISGVVVIAESHQSQTHPTPVSYTHLTLLTILRV